MRLEYTGLTATDYEARVGAERRAEQHLWDFRVGGVSPTVYTRQFPQGWYDPIRPLIVLPEVLDDSKWLGGLDAGFLDKEKQRAYAFVWNTSEDVTVNLDIVSDGAIRSFQDLLDPRWKGKIAMDDPRGRGPGSNALTLMRRTLGEDAARRLLLEQ